MLELVVPLDSLQAAATAHACLDLLGEQNEQSFTEVNLYHAAVKVASLTRKLKNRKAFHLDGPGFDLRLSSVKNHGLGFLAVDGIEVGRERAWVERFGGQHLVLARVYDKEYEHWQNAEDPLEYEAEGRSMDGLPMKSNDLPPPLDQMVVDTSQNPGRRVLMTGYVEAVGHHMWLGPEFFNRVPGVDRGAVLGAASLHVEELDDGVLELVAHLEPFVNDTTAAVQNRLRALLFATTA